MEPSTLALADVHRLTVETGGRQLDVFVFDHHRSAFAIWCTYAARLGRPLGLATLDRHQDLERPAAPPPPCTSPLEALDAFARHRLSPRNDDHVRAALDAGALDRVYAVARTHEPADRATLGPRVVTVPTLGHARDLSLLASTDALALDVDLDCFTTRSDGHPDEVLPWDRDQIEAFLRPPGAAAFWATVLPRTRVVTLAREPYHCGGFARAARLWVDFAEVFFRGVLGVPPP